jgi:hypothetical protein
MSLNCSRGEATAAFMFVSESAVFNRVSGEVHFTVTFNQPPDFLATDSLGRQTNSFQYFIIGDPTLPYPETFDTVIRGEEIHVTKNALRIRSVVPPDSDPQAGGWGPVRGTVPFILDGTTLTFSTPLPLISDHSADGRFGYRLESYEFGGLTRFVDSQSLVIPEPSTAALLATGIVALSCWYGWNRRRSPDIARRFQPKEAIMGLSASTLAHRAWLSLFIALVLSMILTSWDVPAASMLEPIGSRPSW